VEIESGDILFDNRSVCHPATKISDLRSRLLVLMQEPVLFGGFSIRFQLDPFNLYSDEKLESVLKKLGLWERLSRSSSNDNIAAVSNNEPILLEDTAAGGGGAVSSSASSVVINPLDVFVQEGGSNFSLSERQLLVIARAMIKSAAGGANILACDEPTAFVDSKTDRMVQKLLRSEFSNCTQIVIAHRILSIIDSDIIIVMHSGEVAEMDSPRNLLAKKEGSLFYEMCRKTGNLDNLIEIANGRSTIFDCIDKSDEDEEDEIKK
jgi:ABC-type multidrug transport system fused ATPase/permease subunit